MEEYDCLKLDRQLCFPLYAAARKVIAQYSEPLARIGLTYTQYVTMMVLWEEKTVSVKELGRRLYLDSGTLTPLLKSMEKKGLIVRARSKSDERVVELTLTEAGARLRDQAAGVPAQVSACVKLPQSDAKELYRLLYQLLGAIE